FPQVNWGYHVLTDTLGLATAFLSALAAAALIEWGSSARARPGAFALGLVGLLVLQALAYLARETGWMVPVVVAWLLAARVRRGGAAPTGERGAGDGAAGGRAAPALPGGVRAPRRGAPVHAGGLDRSRLRGGLPG